VPQSHSLCPAGDDDWATFTLAETSAVTLETSGATGDTRLWLTLSNQTITGTQLYQAAEAITLGPALTVAGTDVTVFAGQRVVIGNGTAISGSFTVRVGAGSCS
jgi:hypothetical protein